MLLILETQNDYVRFHGEHAPSNISSRTADLFISSSIPIWASHGAFTLISLPSFYHSFPPILPDTHNVVHPRRLLGHGVGDSLILTSACLNIPSVAPKPLLMPGGMAWPDSSYHTSDRLRRGGCQRSSVVTCTSRHSWSNCLLVPYVIRYPYPPHP